MNPPTAPRSAAAIKSPVTSTSAPGMPAADKASSSERSTSEKSASDKSATDNRDSTLVPAPTSSSASATMPARPETKSESGAVGRAVGPKSIAKSTSSEAKASPMESKSAMAVTESPTKRRAAHQAAAKVTTPAPSSTSAGDASYWVQVGAFKDPDTAKRVARKLRD